MNKITLTSAFFEDPKTRDATISMLENSPELFGAIVDKIDTYALSKLEMKKLVIPRGVHTIAPKACINNSHIEVLDARYISSLGDLAFAHCPNLREIYLPCNLRFSAGHNSPFFNCPQAATKVVYCDENGNAVHTYENDPYEFKD